MTKDILIEMLLGNRLYIFKSDYGKQHKWMVFENLLEEGAGVRKQIGTFPTETEAKRFLVLFREEMRKYYNELLEFSVNPECKLKPPVALTVQRLMEQAELNEVLPTRGYEPRTSADEAY